MVKPGQRSEINEVVSSKAAKELFGGSVRLFGSHASGGG